MWRATFALSSRMVSEWSPVFPFAKMLLAGASQKPQARPFAEKVVVRQFARANNGMLADTDPALDNTNTENVSEMKKEVEESTLHRTAKVHDFLEMWQGSQNLRAMQKESHAQNMQITTVGYISDTEEVAIVSWSVFQHDGAAAFTLTEKSPLPPPFSAMDLPGGQIQILNVRRIRKIIGHPVKSEKNSIPESISDTKDWLDWNGDLDNPNDSEDDWTVDVESDMEQQNSIDDQESPEQWDVSAGQNVCGLIRPTRKFR
jgi:hypothetical protein